METNERQLWFISNVDNTKLKEAAEKAKQDFKDLAGTAKDAGLSIDQAFKLAAANQKETISNISREIDDLKAKLKSMPETWAFLPARANLNRDISADSKILADEKSKLLALQKAQIAGNSEEAASNSKVSESQVGIFSGLGKWVIGLASVAAAMKIGKNIIESTSSTAHEFTYAMSAAESGLSYFWKTLATGNFSNFFANMDNAISMGYRAAQMLQEVKEMGWAQSMLESDYKAANAQLEIDLRDRTKSPQERIAAGNVRIANEKLLSDKRIKIAQKELDTYKQIAVERSKLDEDTLLGIIRNTDATTKTKAEALNKLRDQFNNHVPYGISKEDYVAVSKTDPAGAHFPTDLYNQIESAPPEVKLYADALKGYGDLKENMITNIIGGYNKLGDAQASALNGTKRIRTLLNSEKEQIIAQAQEQAKKLLDFDNEYGTKRVELAASIMQQVVNAEADGQQKERDQAQQHYEKTLADINKQQAEELKAYNSAVYGKNTSQYLKSIPQTALNGSPRLQNLVNDGQMFDQKKILAAKDREEEISKINKDYALKAKNLWDEVMDYHLTAMDKELAQSKVKYDEMIEKATKLGQMNMVPTINYKRDTDAQDIKNKYLLKELEDRSQIAQKSIDAEGSLTASNEKWEEQNNAITRQINLLRSMSDEESHHKADVLEQNQALDTQIQKMNQVKEIIQNISTVASSFVSMLEDTNNITSETAKGVNNMIQGFSKFTSGDIIGGAMDFLKQPIEALLSLGKTTQITEADFTKEFDQMKSVIEQLGVVIDAAFGTQKLIDYQAQLKALKVDMLLTTETLNSQIDTWNKTTVGGFSSLLNPQLEHIANISNLLNNIIKVNGQYVWESANLSIEEYNKNIVDAETNLTNIQNLISQGGNIPTGMAQTVTTLQGYITQLTQLEQTYEQTLTGTTAESITQSIVQGFQDGYTTVADFADNFENVMKTAILNGVKSAFLDNQLQEWYQQLSKDLEKPGGITKTDMTDLQSQYDNIITNANNAVTTAEQIAGISSVQPIASRTAATGSLTSMSQDSADKMSGVFTEIQSIVFDISESMKTLQDNSGAALLHLAGIETNTAPIAQMQKDMSEVRGDISAVKDGIDTINLKGILIKK